MPFSSLTGHMLSYLVLGSLDGGRIKRHFAQPKGDYSVGQGKDLFEAVADEDYRYLLFGDPLYQPGRRFSLAKP